MLKGSCLCNAIRYEINGELGDAAMCHCSKCRKASGAAYAVNANIKKDEFNIVSGKEYMSEFESSPNTFRVFCSQCGSPLYSRRPVTMPDTLRLRVGSLDTEVNFKPVAHIFVDSKAAWDTIHDDNIPQYSQRP